MASSLVGIDSRRSAIGLTDSQTRWRNAGLELVNPRRDIDILATHLDRVNGHRLDRRHAERPAGPHVEASPVARAFDLAADQFAFGERAAVVCTDVVDRIELAIDVEDGDRRGRQPRPASCLLVGQFGAGRDLDECDMLEAILTTVRYESSKPVRRAVRPL